MRLLRSHLKPLLPAASMNLQLTLTARRAGLTLLAAAALGLPAAPAARADGMPGMPGMSAEQHAHMSATTPAASDHDSMPGMSADEHAQMSDSPAAGDDKSMPGMDMSGHDQSSANTKRPVGLVLGGFALFNVLVLVYAAVIRRRPAAVKRRQTLARVRSASPKQTVFAPSPGEKS